MNVRSVVSKLSLSVVSLVALITLSHCAKKSHKSSSPSPKTETPSAESPSAESPSAESPSATTSPEGTASIERADLIAQTSTQCIQNLQTAVAASKVKAYCDCAAPKIADMYGNKCGVVGTKVNLCEVSDDEPTAATNSCGALLQ